MNILASNTPLLTKYIDPWMAILFAVQNGAGQGAKVVYFDGFCGPGVYYDDESKTDEMLWISIVGCRSCGSEYSTKTRNGRS